MRTRSRSVRPRPSSSGDGLWRRIPVRVRRHLQAGIRGAHPETPKPGSALFRRIHNVLVGNNTAAVAAAGVAKPAQVQFESRKPRVSAEVLTLVGYGDGGSARKLR